MLRRGFVQTLEFEAQPLAAPHATPVEVKTQRKSKGITHILHRTQMAKVPLERQGDNAYYAFSDDENHANLCLEEDGVLSEGRLDVADL